MLIAYVFVIDMFVRSEVASLSADHAIRESALREPLDGSRKGPGLQAPFDDRLQVITSRHRCNILRILEPSRVQDAFGNSTIVATRRGQG